MCMTHQGEEMLEAGWQRWPNDLPVGSLMQAGRRNTALKILPVQIIMLWGTANEVNSPRAGIDLFEKLAITDKRLVTYQVGITHACTISAAI